MASLIKEYSKEKLQGQIFTPFFVVEKILDDVGFNSEKNIIGKTILDPACGDGQFLIKIVERVIKYSSQENLKENLENIYGWDIDNNAVKIAIKRLNNLIKDFNIKVDWNIKVKNSLKNGASQLDLFGFQNIIKFDYIVGNPPYIRIQHLDIKDRKFIQDSYKFCKSGSTDIFIAFYELAINLLNDSARCGFITPNTFFHTDTAKLLRDYFSNSQTLIQITNYRDIQLFDNATSYSAIVIFDKHKRDKFKFEYAEDLKSFKVRYIGFEELKDKKFWQLSLTKDSSKKGKRLGDIADIHVGITTLADKIYIMPFEQEEDNYVLLKSKYLDVIKIEKEILKPIVKVSKLKSADDPVKEYILFPYKKLDDKNMIIDENELSNKYPLAYKYLLAMKDVLDKRDAGKTNLVAWYAFGRSQGLNNSFGEKILFSPMNYKPNFIYHKNSEATFYSGYSIKYNGNKDSLLEQLNSKRMEEFIKNSSRDFRGGWKAYNKRIVQEFMIYE